MAASPWNLSESGAWRWEASRDARRKLYLSAFTSLPEDLTNLSFFSPATSSVLQEPTAKLLPKWALFSSLHWSIDPTIVLCLNVLPLLRSHLCSLAQRYLYQSFRRLNDIILLIWRSYGSGMPLSRSWKRSVIKGMGFCQMFFQSSHKALRQMPTHTHTHTLIHASTLHPH